MNRVFSYIVQAGFIFVFIILGFVVASVNLPTSQVSAQTCTTPTQVQGVTVTFPYCSPTGECQFTQASCTWTALTGAANYQITVVNSTTNTQVSSQQVSSSTTSFVFPVTANNTYTCTVAALNSCGTSGPSNSHSLLCAVDALVNTPTIAPPTSTPIPPQATPPPTGIFENTLLISLGALVFVAGGVLLMLL